MKEARKYKGLGLVEATLAIFIVGIVAISFMGIAAHSLMNYYRLELYDKIANQNVTVNEQFRAFLSKRNDPDSLLRLSQSDITSWNSSCFTIEDDSMVKLCSSTRIDDCRKAVKDDTVFSVLCFSGNYYDESSKLIKAQIVGGGTKCSYGNAVVGITESTECLVEDQKYNVIYKVLYVN